MTNNIKADIQSLSPSAMITMFEIDLTALGDSVYRFHMGTNELEEPLVFDGETYKPWAGQASGFDFTTNGQAPRPKLILGNTLGTITALVILLNDCVGGKVTRIRTLAKYIDAVNFTSGVNDDADPDAKLPDDIYFINRKVSEDNEAVEFELAAAYDVTNVMLPKRQIIQNLCPWAYRGGECGYAGPPVADRNDNYLGAAQATTPEEIDLVEKREAMFAALAVVPVKAALLSEASVELTKDRAFIKSSSQYNAGFGGAKYYVQTSTTRNNYGRNEVTTTTAIWNNSTVTLGNSYRAGSKVSGPITAAGPVTINNYRIEYWVKDAAAEAAAQAAYDTAETEYNDALAAHAAAIADYDAAQAALPADANIYNYDRCGKRLASCKLRFGEDEELPFGGYPGAGILS